MTAHQAKESGALPVRARGPLGDEVRLIQQLQRAVQMHLDPTRRVFDALPRVVRPPPLHEAQPEDAQPPQIIHADPGRRRQPHGRSDAAHRAGSRDVSGHGGRLGGSSSVGCGCLLLHLPVALPQVKHLNVSSGVDFVHGVAGGSAGLTVQVITLHEHCVVAQTPHPHIALPPALQLHALPDVQPGPLAGVGAVYVGELPQAEAVPPRGVHITIHDHQRAAGGHLEDLPHLHVHLEVGDGAPEFRPGVGGYGLLVWCGAVVWRPVMVGVVQGGL